MEILDVKVSHFPQGLGTPLGKGIEKLVMVSKAVFWQFDVSS